MPFSMVYSPTTISGAIIDAQAKIVQPTIAPIFWGTALRLIYTDLSTNLTTNYLNAIIGVQISFPPASPPPATIIPTPLNLAPLIGLADPGGVAIDAQVKAVLGQSTLTWTAFFSQLYTDLGTQLGIALSTAFNTMQVMAQPAPVPGVGLLAPAKLAAIPPFTPVDFASITAQLSALAPASAATVDPLVRAGVAGSGPAGGIVTWDIVIAQITADVNQILVALGVLIPGLFISRFILGPTSAPPALAAPVPPAAPTPIPPTPPIVV